MNKEKEMQATDLQRFIEETSNVCIRAQVINGQPWFVAKDICLAIGISQYRDAIARLDDDERVSVVLDTLGGKQCISAVNESGLYALIFQSRKPTAKSFRKWVTKEVLPSLRRNGIYATPSNMVKNGVQGMFYDGKLLYPYSDMLRAIGFSTRSGSVQKRRRNYPQYFIKVFGRNFVTPELVKLLEDERKLIVLRGNMRNVQQFLPFAEEMY